MTTPNLYNLRNKADDLQSDSAGEISRGIDWAIGRILELEAELSYLKRIPAYFNDGINGSDE